MLHGGQNKNGVMVVWRKYCGGGPWKPIVVYYLLVRQHVPHAIAREDDKLVSRFDGADGDLRCRHNNGRVLQLQVTKCPGHSKLQG
jgi:hypothetical protein